MFVLLHHAIPHKLHGMPEDDVVSGSSLKKMASMAYRVDYDSILVRVRGEFGWRAAEDKLLYQVAEDVKHEDYPELNDSGSEDSDYQDYQPSKIHLISKIQVQWICRECGRESDKWAVDMAGEESHWCLLCFELDALKRKLWTMPYNEQTKDISNGR